jgi:hypothetical protein
MPRISVAQKEESDMRFKVTQSGNWIRSYNVGDFVTVLHPAGESFNGSGRVIERDGDLFAVERDDCDEVTWHGLDELRPE